MSATNRGERGGGGLDFFETPTWVTDLIVPHVLPPAGVILDPCAGRGAMIGRLPLSDRYAFEVDGAHKEALSLSLAGYPVCIRDALSEESWSHPDGERPSLIIMNPPFVHSFAFVKRALAEVAPGGTVAALLRAAFLESDERYPFNRDVTAKTADLFVLPNRPSFTSDRGTDSAIYAWFVWSPGRGGRYYVLPSTPKEIRCPRRPRAPRAKAPPSDERTENEISARIEEREQGEVES